MVPDESTVVKISFKWLHNRIPLTNFKVKFTQYMSSLLAMGVKGLTGLF